MSIRPTLHAASLLTDRGLARTILIALTDAGRTNAAVRLAARLAGAVVIGDTRHALTADAVRGLAAAGGVAVAATAQPDARGVVDRLTILSFGAGGARPTPPAGQLGALKPRLCAVHLGAAILVALARVTHLRRAALALAADHPGATIPCPLALADVGLASPTATDLAAPALRVVDATAHRVGTDLLVAP